SQSLEPQSLWIDSLIDAAVGRFNIIPSGRSECGDRAAARAPVPPGTVPAPRLLVDYEVERRRRILPDELQWIGSEDIANCPLDLHVTLGYLPTLVDYHIILTDATRSLSRLEQLSPVEYGSQHAPARQELRHHAKRGEQVVDHYLF